MTEATTELDLERLERLAVGEWAVLTRAELQQLIASAQRETLQRTVVDAARQCVEAQDRWLNGNIMWAQSKTLDIAERDLRVAIEKLDAE